MKCSGIDAPRRYDSKLIPLFLFAAGCITTALQFPTVRLGHGYETLAIARYLAGHGEFANPFNPHLTGPSAWAPPLYPAFLALLIRIFGDSAAFALAIDAVAIGVHGLHAALLPSVSHLFFGDRRPGICAGVVMIVLPVFFLFPQYEIMYVGTGLLLFCLWFNRLLLSGGMAAGFGAGLGIGSLALLNPASITVSVLWAAYAVWRHRPAHLLRFVCCGSVAAVITLMPWTLRNYRQFHELFFVRDNMGLELYIANNDLAEGSFALNELNGTHRKLHPGLSETENRACATLGEAEYCRQRGAMALNWIHHHPRRFAVLTATRLRMFWFPNRDGFPYYAYSIAFVTILAVLGMLLLASRREPPVIFFVSASLVFPLLYCIVQSDPRYRTPFRWIPLLAAGYFLANLQRYVPRLVGGKV